MGRGFLADLDNSSAPLARRLATATLVEQRPPGDADREEMERLAQARASQGATLDAVLQEIDAGQQRVWSECAGRASGAGGVSLLTVVGSLLLSWHGALTAATVETFQRLHGAGRSGDRDRRAAVLHAVLTGAVDAASVPGLLETANAGETTWRALRARPVPPTTTALLGRALESAIERSGGQVATVAGDVYGIVAARPRIRREMGHVGLGPPGDARVLPSSFVTATRVLEAAQALDARGVAGMEDLRLRLGVVEAKGVGREVVRRCLEPLTGLGASGRALRTTLAAYVENGARVEPTAEALGVHPNTVRNRLHRYQEVTGLDLGRIDDLVELWWSLERDRLGATARATGQAAPG